MAELGTVGKGKKFLVKFHNFNFEIKVLVEIQRTQFKNGREFDWMQAFYLRSEM